MSLCVSVCPGQSAHSSFFWLISSSRLQDDFRMTQRALSMPSESTQKALREYLRALRELSERKRESDFIIPSEPKILRLVFKKMSF